MSSHPKMLNTVFLMIFFLLSAGCAKPLGYGTITEVQRVYDKNHTPQTRTLKAAGAGSVIGAGAGAVAGGVFALGTLGFGLFAMPAFIAGGTAAGAGVGVASVVTQNLYQYTVTMEDHKTYPIYQYCRKPFALHERVKVSLKDDKISIDTA